MTGADFVPGKYECGKSLKSLNAGKDCQDDEDCKTNENGVFAACKCSYGQTSKICDISTDDKEWAKYHTSVETFISKTANCHNARDFSSDCGMEEEFNDLQCLKATAKNYVENLNAEDCINNYANPMMFPEVDEV